MTPNWKPLAATRRLAKKRKRLELKNSEGKNKGVVRRRDLHRCRFPLCGCRLFGLRLEVSHVRHKGMGGNPAGDRSTPGSMVLLCVQRHQDGAVSRHRGTIRARYLTSKEFNGPVAWEVDLETCGFPKARARWFEVARESKVQQLEPLTPKQREILEYLALMQV